MAKEAIMAARLEAIMPLLPRQPTKASVLLVHYFHPPRG
jgi:hypothetical protein